MGETQLFQFAKFSQHFHPSEKLNTAIVTRELQFIFKVLKKNKRIPAESTLEMSSLEASRCELPGMRVM